MTVQITKVSADRRETALRLLFSRFPLEEQPSRTADALRAAESNRLDLGGLLIADEEDRPVGAALVMLQADGVALVWPPVMDPVSHDPAAAEWALMNALCQEIERGQAKLAQCLLTPDDTRETELLKQHGFDHSADLFFMARQLTPADEVLNQQIADLQTEPFHPENRLRFARTIELSYQGSLDCQFLNGFRSGEDALFSHQLSGQFDPATWQLYSNGSQDVGILLMSSHPEQQAMELVYLGVVPEFRGRGLGRSMLSEGIRAAATSGHKLVFLAVDCANNYANSLYSEFGFVELARRRVMIRPSHQMARE